jgi:hypothetical protein
VRRFFVALANTQAAGLIFLGSSRFRSVYSIGNRKQLLTIFDIPR